MFLFVVLFAVGTAALEPYIKPYYDLEDAHNLFKDFVQEHGKVYSQEEYATRLEIFKQNLAHINERNSMHPQSLLAANRYADWTPGEIRGLYSMRLSSEEIDDIAVELHYPPEAITAPEQFDWRDHGAVAHVKDQTPCFTCWIFCTVGNVEGQYAIKHKKVLAFSEQQGVDCIQNRRNESNCEAGYPWDAMEYFKKQGVILEKDNPYTAEESTCHEDTSKVVTKVVDYKVLKPDEETLKQLVYDNGPLAVGIDPWDLTFQKGIVFPKHCGHVVYHCMLLVGYGIENGTKYWILKDSGGLGRGDQGYFKLVRGINACAMGTSFTITSTVV